MYVLNILLDALEKAKRLKLGTSQPELMSHFALPGPDNAAPCICSLNSVISTIYANRSLLSHCLTLTIACQAVSAPSYVLGPKKSSKNSYFWYFLFLCLTPSTVLHYLWDKSQIPSLVIWGTSYPPFAALLQGLIYVPPSWPQVNEPLPGAQLSAHSQSFLLPGLHISLPASCPL